MAGRLQLNQGEKIMNYNAKIYGQLLVDTLPGMISDETEYERTETIFNGLMNKGDDNLSPEENRLFELMANLLEGYERRTLSPLTDTTPPEKLRFLMQENDLKQTDLDDVFGSQAVVSKVLSGKRSISKAQAKRLAERFRMTADVFI